MSRGKNAPGAWSFQRHRAQAAPYSPLSRQEERDAFTRMRSGDEEARTLLAMSNLRLVLNLAAIYRDAPVEPEELVQAGCVGLMEALDRFNPHRGVRFSSYSQKAIRGAMRAYLRQFSPLQDELSSGGRGGRSRGPLPPSWQVLPKVVVDSPEEEILRDIDRPAIRLAAARALYWLPERERQILLHRYDHVPEEFLCPWPRQRRSGLIHVDFRYYDGTLTKMGWQLHLSAERIRQVCNRALRELRKGAAGYWLRAFGPPGAGPYRGPEVFLWATWIGEYLLAEPLREDLSRTTIAQDCVVYARTGDPVPVGLARQVEEVELFLRHHGLGLERNLPRGHDPRGGIYADLGISWATRPQDRPGYPGPSGLLRQQQVCRRGGGRHAGDPLPGGRRPVLERLDVRRLG